MEAEEIDRLLTRLDPVISSQSALVHVNPPGTPTVAVIGDTHGDWRSTRAAMEWFLESPSTRAFVGLGDYIDRAPPDCPGGSAVNALYLLSIEAAHPDRVFLIQGNHETARRIPVSPHSLPDEMASQWGEDRRRYSRLLGLLERGPLAGYTSSGVFLAHGGFPSRLASPWTERFRSVDETLLAELAWRDIAASRLDRGLSPSFNEEAMNEFLRATGLHVFLRGHDPGVVGRPLYHDRCLTLHTSRMYERYGGILVAHVPLDRPVNSLRDIEVLRLRPESGSPVRKTPRRTRAPPNGAPAPNGRSDRRPANGH
ncbi:MAG: metallophosphoesterase [Thermoplasmata archaeon]|nr:metallophosphoesterase [Thermoplasmata archaeon]